MWPVIAGIAVVGGAIISELIEQEILREEEERQRKAAAEEEKRLLNSGIYEVDSMTGKEFEKVLDVCFRKLGYGVRLTSDSQDYGADLIVYKDGLKTVVQAKRKKNPVGINAVQEVVSAIRHYKADKAMVITNNYFTTNAYNLARSNEIELWDRKRLSEFMLRAKNSNVPPYKGSF